MDKATKAAERTKRNGVYNITGQRNTDRLTDEVLYAVVSMLESAIYDAQAMLFAPPEQEEEETHQESPITEPASFLDIPVEETATEEQPEAQQPKKRGKRGNLELMPTQETSLDEQTPENTVSTSSEE
jgi:hypothetical protein